jgi:hypothetical protein
LGFAVPDHPLQYQALANNIEKLQNANHAYRNRVGDNIGGIRGEAVNVFVELERFLSHSLAFMTWVLTSDHYTGTRFSYEVGRYHRPMAELFRTYQNENGTQSPILFDAAGKNTLFPLISGFRLLADYCRNLISNRYQYERLATENPGYADQAALQVFPFRHTRFILDLRENIRATIISELVEITTGLEAARVAGIRNRFEHNREDFPTKDEVSSFLESLAMITERMEKMGLAPLSYTPVGSRTDKWGRVFNDFENYKGETISIPYRAELGGSGLPSGGGFLIIIPSIKIGDTEELARFLLQEPSDFHEVWRDYPIKRFNLQNEPP